MHRSPSSVRIGVAIGEGTGPELAAIFQRAVLALAQPRGLTVDFDTLPHRFRTYASARTADVGTAARAAHDDALAYETFLRDLVARGGRVVFRTAFNAEPLYDVRERLLAVKVDIIPDPPGEIVLVRDCTQGFYGGHTESSDDGEEVRRHCSFTRSKTRRVLQFAVAEAATRFGGVGSIDRAVVACKFHLLGPLFARWVDECSAELGVPFAVWQPDTTNRHLLRQALRGRVLIVGSNEWADVMHVELIARYGLGTQEQQCSRTTFLDDAVAGLEEVQTVHGSADDLAGLDTVNPTATLRAAAVAIERAGEVAGAVAAMDVAIAGATDIGFGTADAGGTHRTSAVVDAVLARLAAGHAPAAISA